MAKGYSARRGFTGGAGMMQQQAQMQQKIMKMQQDMAKAQEEVEQAQFTASVGGGVVTAVVSGKKELTSLTIKPDAACPCAVWRTSPRRCGEARCPPPQSVS